MDVKQSQPVRETGTVSWFAASTCHGTVTRDKGGEISVNYSSFREKDSLFLVKGCRVEFTVVQTAQGTQSYDLILID